MSRTTVLCGLVPMFSGTGIVTSVPSDAPDDYAALRDLKKKAVSDIVCSVSDIVCLLLGVCLSVHLSVCAAHSQAFRQKFNIKDEMVLPFDPVRNSKLMEAFRPPPLPGSYY